MTPTREQIARAIIGPRLPVHPSSNFTLEQLRDVRWQHQSTDAQRHDALDAADAVLTLFAGAQEDTRAVNWIQAQCYDGEMGRCGDVTIYGAITGNITVATGNPHDLDHVRGEGTNVRKAIHDAIERDVAMQAGDATEGASNG